MQRPIKLKEVRKPQIPHSLIHKILPGLCQLKRQLKQSLCVKSIYNMYKCIIYNHDSFKVFVVTLAVNT